MRVLGRLACASVLSAAFLAGSGLPSGAGAWTRVPGEGQLILTTARRMAPAGSMLGGGPDRDTNISQIYLEYGLLDDLTIGGKTYVELSSTDLERSSAAVGAFLRKRVWRDAGGSVASVEAGYAHPIDSLLGGAFAAAEPGAVPEAYLAGLYGHGWGDAWSGAFVSTGAAYHWRGDGLPDELRGEVTAGYRPWRRVMGMLSLFGLVPLSNGSEMSLRIAPSIAYTMWPRIRKNEKKPKGPIRPNTVQLGASYDILNPGDGLGLSISIWRSF